MRKLRVMNEVSGVALSFPSRYACIPQPMVVTEALHRLHMRDGRHTFGSLTAFECRWRCSRYLRILELIWLCQRTYAMDSASRIV